MKYKTKISYEENLDRTLKIITMTHFAIKTCNILETNGK